MHDIIVIDDDRQILSTLDVALKGEGFDVETYSDPVAALPKVIFVPPRLLVLNGHMPDLHGIEFFLKYRTYCRGPVVFLSASAAEIEAKLAANELPATAYVDKPFSIRQFVLLVKSILRSGAPSPPDQATGSPPARPHPNR
ncbi:MAG: response regulator [Hyphomicrobiaceae bacterium]